MKERDSIDKKITPILFICIGLAFTTSVIAASSICPDMDFDDDCVVDFNDFAIFASQWLARRIDCNQGYEDCDGLYYTGCETHVAADINNCGSCGNICDLPNASADCIDANCVVVDCLSGYGNCDDVNENGCEINLVTDPQNCGFCGNVCSFPNGTAGCEDGNCVLTGCNYGYANCDGQQSNGCEENLNNDPPCSSAQYIGEVDGDNGCVSGPGKNGRGENWYRILVNDTSNPLPDKLYLRVRLQSPSGVDYDLYLYDSCSGGSIAASTNSGTIDEINYSWTDTSGDDSRYFFIEVRYYVGSSCSNWSLLTWGGCSP